MRLFEFVFAVLVTWLAVGFPVALILGRAVGIADLIETQPLGSRETRQHNASTG